MGYLLPSGSTQLKLVFFLSCCESIQRRLVGGDNGHVEFSVQSSVRIRSLVAKMHNLDSQRLNLDSLNYGVLGICRYKSGDLEATGFE